MFCSLIGGGDYGGMVDLQATIQGFGLAVSRCDRSRWTVSAVDSFIISVKIEIHLRMVIE